MGDRDITIFFNDDKLNALERRLAPQGRTIEGTLMLHLDKLYAELVPASERSEIDQRIAQERAQAEAEREAARRFAVIHLHDAENDYQLTSELHTDFFQAARLYRLITKELKGPGSLVDRMSKSFMAHQSIDPRTFSELCDRMPYDSRITAIIEFDFEEGAVGVCQSSDNSWWYYNLKDVSNAVYRAERKSDLRWDTRKEIFESSLEGKELDVYGEEESQDEAPPALKM